MNKNFNLPCLIKISSNIWVGQNAILSTDVRGSYVDRIPIADRKHSVAVGRYAMLTQPLFVYTLVLVVIISQCPY